MSQTQVVRILMPFFAMVAILSIGRPVSADSDAEIAARINQLIEAGYRDNEVTPSERASDAEFARRSSLDIIGRIPELEELIVFLEDESSTKREQWVDRLLDDEAYTRNWTSIWGNLLVGRANNRGGGRAALDGWLRNAFNVNLSHAEFVKDLVTAEGSSDEN